MCNGVKAPQDPDPTADSTDHSLLGLAQRGLFTSVKITVVVTELEAARFLAGREHIEHIYLGQMSGAAGVGYRDRE